ncbi:MAG: hypothetical protein V4550_09135 [Gemmatimonadota bacterium]
MSLRFSESARAQIRAYLDGEEQKAGIIGATGAQIELRRIMEHLAKDPALGSAPTGPFETRPIYQFRLEASSRRLAQVSYRVSGEYLEVLLFSSTPV